MSKQSPLHRVLLSWLRSPCANTRETANNAWLCVGLVSNGNCFAYSSVNRGLQTSENDGLINYNKPFVFSWVQLAAKSLV